MPQAALILHCNKNNSFRFVIMLQACLYADRHAMDTGFASASDHPRSGSTRRLRMSALAWLGRTVLRGRPSDPLSDHLLQDIGISRADLEALAL